METFTLLAHEKKSIHLQHGGDYCIQLLGEGAEATVYGNFLAKDSDKISLNITIVHSAKHTRANTVLKGVGNDASSIRFFGKIRIEKGCSDTQSFLEERVLLLSDTATAEAIPELEILCDDVSCSHAASITHVMPQQLFYLQSRGLPFKKAQDFLVQGFLNQKLN